MEKYRLLVVDLEKWIFILCDELSDEDVFEIIVDFRFIFIYLE